MGTPDLARFVENDEVIWRKCAKVRKGKSRQGRRHGGKLGGLKHCPSLLPDLFSNGFHLLFPTGVSLDVFPIRSFGFKFCFLAGRKLLFGCGEAKGTSSRQEPDAGQRCHRVGYVRTKHSIAQPSRYSPSTYEELPSTVEDRVVSVHLAGVGMWWRNGG